LAITNHAITTNSAQSKTSGTSITVTPTSFTVAGGDTLFAGIGTDTGGTAYGIAHTGTAAITWTTRKDQALGSSARAILFRGDVTGAGTVTGVTVSWTTAVTAKALCLAWYSGVGNEANTYSVTGTASSNDMTGASYNVGDLVLGVCASESTYSAGGNGTYGNGSGGYVVTTLASQNGTTGSGSASNMQCCITWCASAFTVVGTGTISPTFSIPANAASVGVVHPAAAAAATTPTPVVIGTSVQRAAVR
jgi:hypothetical protein